MFAKEEWSGEIEVEVRNQGANYVFYPAGRCLGWDRGADVECPAAKPAPLQCGSFV